MLNLLLQKFQSDGATIKRVDGFQMVKQMAAKIEMMMQHKIDAIKVNGAETRLPDRCGANNFLHSFSA